MGKKRVCRHRLGEGRRSGASRVLPPLPLKLLIIRRFFQRLFFYDAAEPTPKMWRSCEVISRVHKPKFDARASDRLPAVAMPPAAQLPAADVNDRPF